MLDVFPISLHSIANHCRNIRVLAHKFGVRREGHVENVVEDQDLAVAIGASADSDGGNRKVRAASPLPLREARLQER